MLSSNLQTLCSCFANYPHTSFIAKENPGLHIAFDCHVSIIFFNLDQFPWLSLRFMTSTLLKDTGG